MGIFSTKAQRVRKEVKGELITFNIKYYRIKASKKYKAELFRKLLGTGRALAVINSRFMYKEQKNNFLKGRQQLIEKLDSSGIYYRRIPIKRNDEASIFGLVVRQSEAKLYEDHVFGLIIESAEIEAIQRLLEGYSLYYYFDCGTGSTDEILDKFETSFDDEEKLKEQFKYFIFDDNFMENMVVSCKVEDAEYIGSILDY